ncbi:hypothetical protein HDU96_005340 [Phlyctochytrium bullatum]|nr:hypothetical protein HDU96_005340 [Phlyctochytrium bullatum]
MKFTFLVLTASALLASVSARFGQEQAVGLGGKVSASGCFRNGDPTAGFGGQEIQNLLAASNPCNKLSQADALVAAAQQACPGTAAFNQVLQAAMDLVAAERNFNPFAGNLDSVCADPSLPATPALRGIIQLVDPRTQAPNNNDPALAAAAAKVNAQAKQVLNAARKALKGPGASGSMADLLAAKGFTAIQGAKNNGGNAAKKNAGGADGAKKQGQQNGQQKAKNNNKGQQKKQAAAAGKGQQNKAAKAKGGAAGGGAGKSLGSCNANDAMIIVGLGADPAGERAQEVRAVVTGRAPFTGQASALNTAIVGNFICDRLADQCRADAGVVAACRAAQGNLQRGGRNLDAAQLQAVGQAADQFNAAIGARTNFAAQLAGGAGAAKAKGNNNNNNNNGGGQKNQGQQKKQANNQGGAAKAGANKGAAGGGCAAQGVRPMNYIIQGQEHRFGVDGRQVALNPAIVVQQICDRAQGDCKNRCEAAGARLVAKGVRGFSGGQDAAKDAANAAAAAAFNAELGV